MYDILNNALHAYSYENMHYCIVCIAYTLHFSTTPRVAFSSSTNNGWVVFSRVFVAASFFVCVVVFFLLPNNNRASVTHQAEGWFSASTAYFVSFL